jgi:sugar O-acyltransferase (sialic acid O-acetyltransferase NeuD family)
MIKKVIVIGSGGHAKVVIDIIELMKDYKIIGITSNSIKKNAIYCNYRVLGEDIILSEYAKDESIFLAMGLGGYKDNHHREKVFNYLKSLGFTFINVIHPSAIISKTVKLGEGVTIFPGVVINTDVVIGNNTIIATGSTIDHETIIRDHVLISAGVTVGAYTMIENGALLALGSKVISGLTIGSFSLIAAGAVVINNIDNNQKVYGIPAKLKIDK